MSTKANNATTIGLVLVILLGAAVAVAQGMGWITPTQADAIHADAEQRIEQAIEPKPEGDSGGR